MSGRGGLYEDPYGNKFYGDGREVEPVRSGMASRFTDEDRKELARIIAEVLDEERERRRKRFLEEKKDEPPTDTRLYLITTGSRSIAFPDERGRAVLNDVFYARVKVKVQDGMPPEPVSAYLGGGRVEVVAYGDGKLLKHPIGAVLPGGYVMVEVEEGFLETL